jgi:N-acetylneuraminic acid mutarotase
MKGVNRSNAALPEHVIRHILFYCTAQELASHSRVSKLFSVEATSAAKAISAYVLSKYFSKCIFESPFYKPPVDARKLLKLVTTQSVIITRGFLTYALNFSSGMWRRCADCRRDRGYFAAVWFKGEVYAIGTYSIIAAGTVEKFNPFTNVWSNVPNLPRKLRSAGAAVLDSKLYVIGGHDTFSETYSDCVFVFDDSGGFEECPSSSTLSCSSSRRHHWEMIKTRMTKPRSRHAAAGFDGKIWIAGGCFEGFTVTRSVECYDPVDNRWYEAPPLTTPRDFSNLLVVNGALYAVGGDVDDTGAQATRTIEMFNRVANEWEHVTAFKDERKGFSTSAIGSKIYIFGGSCDEEQYELNTWDAFDVSTGHWDSDLRGNYQKMPAIDSWGQAVTVPPERITW